MSYLLIFLAFVVFSYMYFRMSYLVQSRGYALIGIGSFLIGTMFFLFTYNLYSVGIALGVVGFLLVQIGFGIVFIKQREAHRLFMKNTNVIQRICGNVPSELIKEIKSLKGSTVVERERSSGIGGIFVGIFSIVAGILIILWKREYGYPSLLIISGIIFFFLGYHSYRRTKGR